VSSADRITVAYAVEALPFTISSDPAVGTGDASIDEVSERYNRQCRSYHGAPSFQLAGYIDSRVTSQMRIFVFTLEVGFAGIYVSFVSVVGVVLSFIFGHDITSLVLLLVFRFALPEDTACIGFGNVSGMAERWGVKATRKPEEYR
jgi:hypothetical protein